MMKSIKEKLLKFPSYSSELGLNLKRPEDRFKWFLSSIRYAKRISSEIAKKTYRMFEEEGLLTIEAIINAGWDKLVEVLDSGGYVRYDFSTASKLLEIAKTLKKKYSSLENLYSQARDDSDLEKKLIEFKGVGPTTVNIFLRELRPIWEKANPEPSNLALKVGKKLSLDKKEITYLESSLLRLSLEFCKKKRCSDCIVRDFCSEFKEAL